MKAIGAVAGLVLTLVPSLAHAEFKQMRQIVFGMD